MGSITVELPVADDLWFDARAVDITWTRVGDIPNTGSHQRVVPFWFPHGPDYTVQTDDASEPAVSGSEEKMLQPFSAAPSASGAIVVMNSSSTGCRL